jgi:hypothetical protein
VGHIILYNTILYYTQHVVRGNLRFMACQTLIIWRLVALPKCFHDSYLFFLIVDTHMATSLVIADIMMKNMWSLYYIYTDYTNIGGFEGGIIPQLVIHTNTHVVESLFELSRALICGGLVCGKVKNVKN